MKEQQISLVKSKLSELLNVKVSYGLSEFTIIDYKFHSIGDRFIIEVDDRDDKFDLSIDSAVDFVRECKSIKSTALSDIRSLKPATENPADKLKKIETKLNDVTTLDTTSTLKNILLENIKNIKSNPAYIPQAQEISKQVGQVINVLRTEMECIRLAESLTENKQ